MFKIYNLTDKNDIKYILKKHGFHFSKSLGQNFLTDENVPKEIARLCADDRSCGIIEIGAGMGTLTRELSKVCKKVVSLEIDTALIPVLKETLAECENVTVINADVLKTDIKKLAEDNFPDMDVYIAANLPYYITTPVIMHILESGAPVKAMTVMVQREVAKRLCADEKSSDYGAISLAVAYTAEPQILFDVPPQSFIPQPSVYSSVVKMTLRDTPLVAPKSPENFFKLIKAAFACRRKTFVNSVCATLPELKKENVTEALKSCNLAENIRGEAINIRDFASLSDLLFKK